MMNTLKKIKALSTQDILRALRVRSGTGPSTSLPLLGGLGAGLAVGAGVAALLTPKTGHAMRKLLSKRAHTVAKAVNKGIRSAEAMVH